MRRPARKIAVLATCCFLAVQIAIGPLAFNNAALACGPFFDQTCFSLTMHPDTPFKLYLKGQLGIIHSSYEDPYQLVAWRYLNGKPLSEKEQAGYLAFWSERYTGGGGGSDHDDSTDSDKWLKDREKIGGKLDPALAYTGVYRSSTPDGFSTYLDCPADAFKTASATLAKLVSKYGADNPICKEWLKGQDHVFCHCAGPSYDYKTNKPGSEPPFPDKLPDSAQLELRHDRQYQMAAAYFYAQKLDDALNLFTAIAADKTSPWQTVARYMVARSLIRKGTLSKKEGYDNDSLAKALASLKPLTTNPDYASFKSSIANLIDFVELRLNPEGSCQALGKQLANEYNGDDLARKIDSYLFVSTVPATKDDDDGWNVRRKAKPPKSSSSPQADDMTNWESCFNSDTKAFIPETAEGFKAHHNLAWAVAYATKLKGTETEAAEVEKVLAKTQRSDPGFITAGYYHALLLLGGKHVKEAEAVIAATQSAPNMTPSAANDLAHLELEHAATFDRFLSLSFRPPAAVLNGADVEQMEDSYDVLEKKNSFNKLAPVLLPESAQAINSTFPLSSFVSAVSSKSVAASYVKQFAQAAFTRAVMLGDYDTAQKMTAELKTSYPSVAKQVGDFESATTPADKEFAAVVIMLKCPGMRPAVTGGTGRGTAFDHIDDYQDNWWGKEVFSDSGDRGGSGAGDSSPPPLATPFFSAADQALSKGQIAKLKAAGDGANYMGKIVIAYAKSHPTDPRVPEALALTVKATHFGSSDQSKTTAVSTQAFQILHKGYSGNPWSKKTPYHY